MSFLNLAFLVCFFCSSLGRETPIQNCHPSDLLALKQFAGNLTKPSNLSLWDGVECEGGRVIKLNLSGKGLQGAVSESLENLGHLRFLDLSHNQLWGGLPLNFSKLNQLEVLDLSHNFFKGPVFESSLNGLETIHTINISSNSFTGNVIDFGEFPALLVLNISNNSFSGYLSSRICSVSRNIRILDFSMNKFTGVLQSLDNCSSSLKELHLNSNSLSGDLPPSLYSILSLEKLSVSGNSFSGQLSRDLSKLSSLKSLVLHGNGFSGVIPDVFDSLTGLECLILHSNLFSGRLPSTLSLCSNLRTLDLKNNSLSGFIDLDFTRLPKLCHLDLASNSFSGTLPESLSSCSELKVLSFSNNRLTGQLPESYGSLTALVFLTLSKNRFEDLRGALSVLQNCPNLSTLVLTKNFNGEEIPENVSGFMSLIIFALGNCGLKGKIPEWLHNCRKLQALDLSWNRLDGTIPSWIGGMDELFYLDLSNNSLSGEIPKSLTMLKSLSFRWGDLPEINISTGIPFLVKRNVSGSSLQYNQVSSFPPSIYLSNNRISGPIWPEIGRLKQLHVLDLSMNNISGSIPESISGMANLEVLDLSHNELYGSIPPSFNKLTFLSRFSVAHNHLNGAIPAGGQFFSFPSSSFDGNAGLCGKIISPCKGIPLREGTPPLSRKGLGRRGILGITISLGAGTVAVLALVLLKMYKRRGDGDSREMAGPEAFGTSKLVLFRGSGCKDLTVSDILKSTDNFNQSNIIGCGGFGLVYKADLPDGTKAAIKRLSGDCGEMEREFQAEVEALSRAQHENLVSLQGYCRHGNDRLLIYSYMANGSLDYWLHESVEPVGTTFLTWGTRLKIARGAARGLAYLHRGPNIIHRDVKTSNILLDERFEAHLADFGLSRLLCPYDTHVTTDLVGTLGYIPPEYSQTLSATFRGDVYSFGVVLLELLTGKRPVEVRRGKSCRNLVSWVLQMKSEGREEEVFEPMVWDEDRKKPQLLEALDIACMCVHQEPRQRPTIDCVVSWLEAIGVDQKDR